MIEYVALGDYGTAVGFLLASTPEKSARYYRDALCTLALAVSHNKALFCLQRKETSVRSCLSTSCQCPQETVQLCAHHLAVC